MNAGEPFRWYEKRIATGSSVKSGGKSVHRPAHVDPLCWQKLAMREELEREVKANLASIESLKAVNAPGEVLALFEVKADEARAKLAAMN
ncbi:hypothetical protein HA052_04125 [Chromobacterium haemolyticum]|uniref:Uncharacterized protein n=1 Tax=Chromobacterium fluminis TaxID=3044269 RepID=A0ABX0L414_9NEIS|nr:hypothetical protein [Chromobacterium haemolyticum]NHR04377.1 hypothetical protein [Chromobacterium haemolyticum]